MSKKIPLDRLREIARQRSQRSPDWPQDHYAELIHPNDKGFPHVEWPIERSLWL
jgi:hypothetical protein